MLCGLPKLKRTLLPTAVKEGSSRREAMMSMASFLFFKTEQMMEENVVYWHFSESSKSFPQPNDLINVGTLVE
jgi:hypothetical protein